MVRHGRIGVVVAVLAFLAGCADGLSNRDTISPTAGWAQVANDDLQTTQ